MFNINYKVLSIALGLIVISFIYSSIQDVEKAKKSSEVERVVKTDETAKPNKPYIFNKNRFYEIVDYKLSEKHIDYSLRYPIDEKTVGILIKRIWDMDIARKYGIGDSVKIDGNAVVFFTPNDGESLK